jgi:hypothetical protein
MSTSVLNPFGDAIVVEWIPQPPAEQRTGPAYRVPMPVDSRPLRHENEQLRRELEALTRANAELRRRVDHAEQVAKHAREGLERAWKAAVATSTSRRPSSTK